MHVDCQRMNADRKWEYVSVGIADEYGINGYRSPFELRNYGVFALFANVRNYSDITPISEPRGYPSDFNPDDDYERHSASWLSIEEIISISPDAMVEDRRNDRDVDHPLPIGTGEIMTMREFLGSRFFDDVTACVNNGVGRIVFDFDN